MLSVLETFAIDEKETDEGFDGDVLAAATSSLAFNAVEELAPVISSDVDVDETRFRFRGAPIGTIDGGRFQAPGCGITGLT